jgi:predicted nucleotide-binding protein (sugar kinase/HSP70/actin superfamily)
VKKPKTIGLPRALLYHRYREFWRTYLTELGFEVKESSPTTTLTIERGLGKVSSEVCLPLKIMAGHVEDLKDRVDYLFMPRLVWMRDELYACPKMIGAPDLARLTVPPGCQVVIPTIKGNFMLPHFWTGMKLTHDPLRSLRACRRAAATLRSVKALPEFPADKKKIALITHFYNLGDAHVARDILSTFAAAGYLVYSKEDLPQDVLAATEGDAKKIRWIYERELYNAFRFYSDKVNGVCAVVSFGCGPDSLIVEMMRLEAEAHNLPFTQLVIDEHTGKAGIVTRLEAFIDTINRRGNNGR